MHWFRKRQALWLGNGLYATPIVGTSYYREAISSIAMNPAGSPALVFCMALLRPFLHVGDPNAVEVHVGGCHVGYLPRDLAPRFRQVLQQNGARTEPSFVRAVITNGLCTAGRRYEYTIELDLEAKPEGWALAWERLPTEKVDRRDAYPALVARSDGAREGRVWLPVASLDELHRDRRVDGWTREEWSSVNFYAENRRGIGLGFKVLEVPKVLLEQWFGTISVRAEFRELAGRWATLALLKG